MANTIQENPENDKILTQFLQEQVRLAQSKRHNPSIKAICEDLGISFISNSPYDGRSSYLDYLGLPKGLKVEASKPSEADRPNSQGDTNGASND